MSHVDDGRLNALLDGELDAAEADGVRAHIAACPDCARRLDEAKQFLAGAADLLGALDLPATVSAPATPVRRVSKTAKEVAIDIDGATHKSPAIRPNLPEPPARAARPYFDVTSLAWAAIIVLALGVGFLADEVRHTRGGSTAVGEGPAGRAGAAAPVAALAPAEPPARGGAHPAAHKGAPSGRTATASRAHAAPAAGAKTAAPSSGKRLVTAPRTARRQPARATAANDLAAAAGAGAPTREPEAVSARSPAAPALSAAANRPAAEGASAPLVGGLAAPSPAPVAFRRVTLEEAVARLNGVIRLMDGRRFVQVQLGPGSLVPGADRARELVRLTYVDSAGRRLVLDQQRIAVPAAGGVVSPDIGMGPGDTLTTAVPGGGVRVRWISGTFWLSLTGDVPPEELRRLMERVR
jgi:anti-sigma factor RsiW